jgi:hypothetical protein
MVVDGRWLAAKPTVISSATDVIMAITDELVHDGGWMAEHGSTPVVRRDG